MKNIFIAGLQRSGTNYAQSLINKNIDINVFWGAFHVEEKSDESNLWKHNIQPLSQELIDKYEIDGSILVIKNPYSWVESILYRDSIDLFNYYDEKYQLLEHSDEGILKVNIRNLIRLYKNFYINWINHGAYLIRYEDLLVDKFYELNKISVLFGAEIKDEIEDVTIVSESPYFTKEDIEKYVNVHLEHLSNKDINTINNELGQGFFYEIGYEIKNK